MSYYEEHIKPLLTIAIASASGSGIKVYGTKRAQLISALPNITSSPYRKLINGGS